LRAAAPGPLRLAPEGTVHAHGALAAARAGCFKKVDNNCAVQLSSVWMDIDAVDFYSEPYDCAILLGNGRFGRYRELQAVR
jgi:hypothetical protein